MPAARVVLRRYFPKCGISTTGHDSLDHGPSNNSHLHQIGNYNKGHSVTISASSARKSQGPTAKIPNFISTRTRNKDKDPSSDQVELCPYSGRPYDGRQQV